ncbi:hypothetical protein HDU87_003467 [Geranomyces variabilis]|uniref:Mitochondrial import inner membrane translocase subunit Tim21 n=1 Tax=Geranomyces variabilis TaxID=109894 RepID=A0AAD5TM94_9FUNG|nr:hypothetical protein HDU87_003467 [Geranomyces variabilis]
MAVSRLLATRRIAALSTPLPPALLIRSLAPFRHVQSTTRVSPNTTATEANTTASSTSSPQPPPPPPHTPPPPLTTSEIADLHRQERAHARREYWETVRWEIGETFRRGFHILTSLGYSSILILGLGVLGAAFYNLSLTIEDDSKYDALHDVALAKVVENDAVRRAIAGGGGGGKVVGVKGRRGDTGVSRRVVVEDGNEVLVMGFAVEAGGAGRLGGVGGGGGGVEGRVHAEFVKDKATGEWTQRLVQVDLPGNRQKPIIVVDNRPVFVMPEQKRNGWFGFGGGSRTAVQSRHA